MVEEFEAVRAAFDVWRASRSTAKGRYPQGLRRRAVALRSQHSDRRIAKALGISDGRVIAAWSTSMAPAPAVSAFVAVPVGDSPALCDAEPTKGRLENPEGVATEVVLEGPGGSTLRMRGGLSPQLVKELVTAVVGRGVP